MVFGEFEDGFDVLLGLVVCEECNLGRMPGADYFFSLGMLISAPIQLCAKTI